MARPKIIYSDDTVELITQYALNNCHMETIALALDIPVISLRRRYGRFIVKMRAEGRAKLRQAQYEKAIKDKDSSLLIFLGKNTLGQADKIETKHGITAATATLMGLIDGSSKGVLPAAEEAKDV